MLAHGLNSAWQSLPILIYLFWSLASGAALIAFLPFPSAKGFRDAVYLSACRGKLWEDRPKDALGSYTDWKVPQAWFAHFYDVGVIANFVTFIVAFKTSGLTQGSLLMSLTLLHLHLSRRCLETHFMMKYPKGSHMHAIAYAFGLMYYIVLPLTCLPPAAFEADLFGAKFHNNRIPESISFRRPDLVQKLGAVVFLSGNLVQYQSHRTLANLSKTKGRGDHAKSQTYGLPKGGAFEYVSCPHYLGEMVIYGGLALVLDVRRLLSWLPLVWVVRSLPFFVIGSLVHSLNKTC